MLPLFQHTGTQEIFVLHYATAADRRRAQKHARWMEALRAANPTIDVSRFPERGVERKKVAVTFAPIKKKPREQAWAEYRKSGQRYH
jgi:hypothetical protein